MKRTTSTTFSVCGDCSTIARTGDATFLDFFYEPDEAGARLVEINLALERIGAGGWVSLEGEQLDEFSVRRCECCETSLPGERFALTFQDQIPADLKPETATP
tara:strand:- start:1379 stop:1687 length:309 start_codon:yes stop_codon:yes gene_type:complete